MWHGLLGSKKVKLRWVLASAKIGKLHVFHSTSFLILLAEDMVGCILVEKGKELCQEVAKLFKGWRGQESMDNGCHLGAFPLFADHRETSLHPPFILGHVFLCILAHHAIKDGPMFKANGERSLGVVFYNPIIEGNQPGFCVHIWDQVEAPTCNLGMCHLKGMFLPNPLVAGVELAQSIPA